MRYTRHELKQDKFAESAAEAVQGVMEHSSGIIRWAVIVVVLAAVAGGGFWYENWSQEKASESFGQAMATYNAPVMPPESTREPKITSFASDQERLIASKTAFYAISSKYGWTRSGKYARYMAGITEQELGNYTVAIEQLKAVAGMHDRELASLGSFALAGTYRGQRKDNDAIALLEGLIARPTNAVPKVNAELALADLYTAEQKPDKAKVLYDQIAKENAKNQLSEIVRARQEQQK